MSNAEPLDSPQSCVQEIISINISVAEFGFKWANAAGELKTLLQKEERLFNKQMRHLRKTKAAEWKLLTVDDRKVEARFEVEEEDPKLYPRIEELEGEVEKYKTQFKALDRRAGNAQSILASIRNEEGIKDFIYYDTPEINSG